MLSRLSIMSMQENFRGINIDESIERWELDSESELHVHVHKFTLYSNQACPYVPYSR